MHTTSRNSLSSGVTEQTENNIFRQYYADNDYILSPEGILKVLCAVVCIVTSVAQLGVAGVNCGAVRAGGGTSLACACVCALLYAAVVLHIPMYAPQLCLYVDIILSSVIGVLLLLIAVLTMSSCDLNSISANMLGPLGILSAIMVISSAVFTYVSVMRLWDKSHIRHEPRQPIPEEQDV